MTTPTSGNSTAETGLPPNYYTHKLANGLQLVGQRMPSLASVTFGIQVAAGRATSRRTRWADEPALGHDVPGYRDARCAPAH